MKQRLLAAILACLCLGMATSVSAQSVTAGDSNSDGKIDVVDVTTTISFILGEKPVGFSFEAADVNGDGKVGIVDVTSIIDMVLNSAATGETCRYFQEESTGDEAIITADGDVMLQNSSDDGGHTVQLCSFDEKAAQWSTEECVLAEVDKEEQLRSLIFSDFTLMFDYGDDDKVSMAVIRHESGDYELLGQFEQPALSRALASSDAPSLVDRVAKINDLWGLVEEPVKAKLASGELNKMKWAGDLWSSFLGMATGAVMEKVGNDFSTTIGNAVGLLVQAGFNIALDGAAFSNPATAALFLLQALQEGKQHVFNELIGKGFLLSDISTERVSWDNYKAAYVVSGIKADATLSPEIDFVYYPRENNAGWAVFPKTITHTCQNKGYVQDLTGLAPGPNELIVEVYIEGYRIFGSFIRRKNEFFVGLNELADFKVDKFEKSEAVISQTVMAYSVNHSDAYPLSDFGTYIRHDDVITRYAHTENVVEAAPSGSGPSISGVNTVTQKLTIEIAEKDLVETSSSEKKPKTDYYIGAYSYNFKTGKYEYYDEKKIDLEYKETTCPDGNHPHMIDLGLPSGTKWACCNVGATSPEDYGDYFAWGETKPKSVYNWDTYLYYNDDTGYVHIGSDIGGTAYDAATANWGAPWRMPSLTQIKELLSSCTSTWTTQGGVSGRKFTGPNRASVFLPAAGYRWNGDLGYAGSCGHYWSSTLNEDGEGYACSLYFYSGRAIWYDSLYRLRGQSVRPVR